MRSENRGALSYDEPLGELRGTRVRPTYVVPLVPEARKKSYFPKTNQKRLSNGMTLHWKLPHWRKVDGSFDDVQARVVLAAAFDGDELACCFRVFQTRNAGDLAMSISRYVVTCDDESASLGEQAEMVEEALECLEGRGFLYPGETACEVSELFVPARRKGQRVWGEAILQLLARLAAISGKGAVCVLKAEPLELAWRSQHLSRDWPKPADEPFPLEDERAQRRREALMLLYDQELAFEGIGGQWMARMVG